MQITTTQARITAVLGPTNTGKTHLAMERLLGHESGIIGFPLRLLARENYERAVAAKGRSRVALITGEEKIVPPGARHFICTVESMPLERPVSFLAVDEIQMCADGERGHVFTDRLLHARGRHETMFLGADTARRRIRQLVPETEFQARPRFSSLTYAGQRKITRLPPRSAVVAFSAAGVYAIAEQVRRQRGGAAVVLGALSPRTRNAQVAMYQNGEVDYLVATDAIGMGLNMDLDHVAFAQTRKFDGRHWRDLSPAEMAQIAGRAGRHMNDGTFGATGDVDGFDADIVGRIENHDFEPLEGLVWRNSELDFASPAALQASLAAAPPAPYLVRARAADDELALAVLARDAEVAAPAMGADAVRRLWEVCRIPDFRKVLSDAHARLLRRVYLYLMAGDGRLPTDWVGRHVADVDRTDGDLETIIQRIAGVRTWTYIAFHGDWLADAGHWRERTRAVEDRLSDALHEHLTQRFVDRRTAVLMRRIESAEDLVAAIAGDGAVLVEGHAVGRLEGFRFVADWATDDEGGRTIAAAAGRALEGELRSRVKALERAPDHAFAFADDGTVTWNGEAVARLAAGPRPLQPSIAPLTGELPLEGRERVRRRLAAWLEAAIGERLEPLVRARRAAVDGAVRGLVFQLCEGLGSVPRDGARAEVEALGREGRKALRRLGVRIGRHSIYMPALLKPGAVEARARLAAAHAGIAAVPPPPGRVSVRRLPGVPAACYEAMGYRPLGALAVRLDMVERLAARAWSLSRRGPFVAGPELLSLLGCGADDMAPVLAALGYAQRRRGDSLTFVAKRRPKPAPGTGRRADSPFAKLGDLAAPR